jgi:hypothetical protein
MPLYEYQRMVYGFRNQPETGAGQMIRLVHLICRVYGMRFWSWEYLCRN